MEVTPIPKPRKRIVDKNFSKAVLARDRRCALCGKPSREAHHLLKRSHGGDDVVGNGLGLCKGDHDDVEAYRIRLTKKDLRPENIEYIESRGMMWKFE